MSDQDFRMMLQGSINLIGILDDYRDQDAEHVMESMMRFVRQVEASRQVVVEQLRSDRNPNAIYQAIMQPSAIISRLHADSLLAITASASRSFADLIDVKNGILDAEASANTVVWINVADQTLVAMKLLFQVSRLYGRAPNGKLLAAPEPAALDDEDTDIFSELGD